MTKTVLFLCTGNYYRSRFAEIVFNHHARRSGLPWRAESRGLALERGVNNVGPLSAHALRRLTELGIPVDDPRMPCQVSEADLNGADLIVGLKGDEHRPLILERHPEWAEHTEFWDIHDDYDQPAEQALPAIEDRVNQLIARLGAVRR
jgi:protein-tyrosine phosphatase